MTTGFEIKIIIKRKKDICRPNQIEALWYISRLGKAIQFSQAWQGMVEKRVATTQRIKMRNTFVVSGSISRLFIWWLLEVYMVVNFRTRGISRGARKLARTPTLIKKKKKKERRTKRQVWMLKHCPKICEYCSGSRSQSKCLRKRNACNGFPKMKKI